MMNFQKMPVYGISLSRLGPLKTVLPPEITALAAVLGLDLFRYHIRSLKPPVPKLRLHDHLPLLEQIDKGSDLARPGPNAARFPLAILASIPTTA